MAGSIATVTDRYRAAVILGAGTGVRVAEALAVTSDRIDWIRREVTIDRQLLAINDGQPVFGPVKDRYNRPRTIPLPQVVVDALAEHVARYGLGPQGLVFTGPNGGPVAKSTFFDHMRAAVAEVGMEPGEGFHELRHFYASLLIRAGESVKVVQRRLGHASAQMTLDVYAHLWPEDDQTTRDAVDTMFNSGIEMTQPGPSPRVTTVSHPPDPAVECPAQKAE